MSVSKACRGMLRVFSRKVSALESAMMRIAIAARSRIASQKGQGTTEYAILVGVLVVIAILAITIFKPKIEELWNAITTGIQGL